MHCLFNWTLRDTPHSGTLSWNLLNCFQLVMTHCTKKNAQINCETVAPIKTFAINAKTHFMHKTEYLFWMGNSMATVVVP